MLAALALEGATEGLWLRAERQTGGKGRQGRAWVSPPGNLHASTLVRLRPGDPPAPTLALVAAVALHEVASIYAPGVQIKWPNDLLFDGAKLAGILLERLEDAVVIGFGVNLAHHPEGIDRPATSLQVLAGMAPEPAAVHRDPRRILRPLAGALAQRGPGAGPPAMARRRPSARHRARAPRKARACSTASTTTARCGCAWRTAPCDSSMPATCS